MRMEMVSGTPRRTISALVLAFLSVGLVRSASGAEPGPGASPSKGAARRAVEIAAPILPAEVMAALQEGRFAEAETLLHKVLAAAKNAEDRGYDALILAITQRLAGNLDAARTTLREALDAAPKGPWTAKLRLELAGIELAAGRVGEAEALARNQAEVLLAGDRKDRLAEVYHAFARRLLKPDNSITPADPKAAYDLLAQARSLAKGETLRARLLFAMAKAARAGNDHARAIVEFQKYLADYPKGIDRLEARYQLGLSQQAVGQVLTARFTWSDLARELEDPRVVASKEVEDVRARAMFAIPTTYGIPSPADDTALNLGVASLRRFLAAYPAHPLAVKAASRIGISYLNRGKSEEALAAFTSFLKEEGFRLENDEAKRDFSQLAMTATFQVGQVLQGQQKFDESIAAWKGYLSKYPNGGQSADAQRAIVDTQLLIAAEHLARERYDEARAAWQAFVSQNPLDPRVPAVLFQVGESFQTEKNFDRAITMWEPLLSKFPNSEPAAHAQFAIAAIEETEKGELESAIDRFRKIAIEPWKSQAGQRIAVMEARALTVVTPRTFRSGETPHLKVMTRNLEKLTFSAYKLNAEAYFRKKHAIGNVESLDIGLVAPDAEWNIEVKGYARFKPIETTYDLAKIEVPGVYVVKVTDEKHLQATTLVVGSDIDAIVKTSRDQILVFAQDMKTGNGRANARVLVSQGDEVILEGKTGEDGVFLKSWDKPRDLGSGLAYLVLDGLNVAGSGLAVPSTIAQGLSARAYIYADRPAYRPGQSVAIRGIVREIKEGQYLNTPKAVYRLEVTDSRGRQFVARPVTLSEFGTFHEHLSLDSGAPVGTYRVRLYQPGKSDFAGQFEVQAYQLQKTDLSFDLEKAVYFRGETVKADLIARFQYGAPAAGRQIVVRLPDGRIVRGVTDAAGKFHVEFPTEGFAQETVLSLVAQLPQDAVATAASVSLAIRAFETSVKTTRDVYLDGESFQVNIATFDPQGKPTGQKLSAALIKVVTQNNRTTEREVARKAVTTDPKTGTATVSLKADDEEGGAFIVRVAGTDRFGNPVVTDRSLTISGKKDDTKLRLLADRLNYKVGEEASVNLHSRGRAGAALLTWEADRILTYRIVKLAEGDNPIGWAVDGPQFPNFTLTAARMAGSDFDEARLDLRVERDLRVTIAPVKPSVEPGGEVTVEVTTVDQLGRPVAAEISLAMVDRSLLQQFADKMAAISTFFYDQTRTGAFATASTNTFSYTPTTSPVSEAVVEEAERSMAMLANLADRGTVIEKAQKQAMGGAGGPNAPMAAPMASAPAQAKSALGMGYGAKLESTAAGRMIYRQAGVRADGENDSAEVLAVDAAANGRFDGETNLFVQGASGLEESKMKRGAVSTWAFNKSLAFGAGSDKWGENQKDGQQRPRERFVETAYWNPSIVTGADGKARVTFKAPTALSQYEFSARGVTGADTLVGQSTAGLSVRKDFFVDLKAPIALTQGDKPRFIGQVHHVGLKGTINARLTAYAGGREQVYPKTLDVKIDGVEEIFFDPFEIPDGENVRLTFSATLGDAKDELVIEIPIRPWGVQAFASASGTSTNDATVFVGLPPGRTYENPEMLVMVSPTLQRLLIELALGRDYFLMRGNFDVGLNPSKNAIASARLESCIFPPPHNTIADRASDLMAAASALNYLKTSRGASAAPEAVRLTDTVRGLVSELTSVQNDDGGWPWVGGSLKPGSPARPSDRTTSGRVVWALALAEPLGLIPDAKTLDKAVVYLTQEFAKVGAADHETRVILLHALSTRGKANFETANSLNRLRQSLSDSALAYLALTFVNLERIALAGEILDILAPRGKTEIATPGGKTRRFWGGTGRFPSGGSPVETTALVALGFAKARPQAAELEGAVEWLLAHREGFGFNPHKAKGPALAALSAYYGRANAAEDRFDLIVSVNETEVYRTRITGAAQGHAILIPRDALKGADTNRIRFDIEGRGTFGYSVTMTGFSRDFKPDQSNENRAFLVTQHIFQPAPAELDGKSLPVGFNVAVGASYFENWAHQVEHGGKVRVRLDTHRVYHAGQQPWERDFLILEDHLPAGGMLVEGSVQTSASHFEEVDGRIRFYFAPDQEPGQTFYDVHGYLPGAYRTLPPILSSAYDPGKRHMATAGVYDLRVLAPGEAKTDPYKATPDELYARGKAHYDAGRPAEAAVPLEELFNAYTLREDIAKDSARMLLLIHIKEYNPRKVVQYFEVVKEKAAELVISFDDLLVIGRAYRDINEYERAYIVWRGVVEASYLEDARVGEVLRQRGKTLEGIAYLLDLWREYPNTASIESDFFAISQVLASHATKAFTDAGLRRELADAGVTRSELILQSIRLTQAFLGQSPKNPLADEASLALVGNFLELEDYPAVVKLAARFAKLYPKSAFLDSFQYSERGELPFEQKH